MRKRRLGKAPRMISSPRSDPSQKDLLKLLGVEASISWPKVERKAPEGCVLVGIKPKEQEGRQAPRRVQVRRVDLLAQGSSRVEVPA
mgnify:CR=1 FL=1